MALRRLASDRGQVVVAIPDKVNVGVQIVLATAVIDLVMSALAIFVEGYLEQVYFDQESSDWRSTRTVDG